MENNILRALMNKMEPIDGERNADGLVVCSVCGKPKEYISKRFPKPVRVMCDCERLAYNENKAKTELSNFLMQLRWTWEADGICDPSFRNDKFENANDWNIDVMSFCKHYAEHWDEYYESNIGLLLYGKFGAGKSFAAHCIANYVMNRGVTVCVTSIPRINNMENRLSIGDKLKRYKLLVIDDLGAERDTSTAQETLYNIIDSRYQSKLPLIITTNLDYYDDIETSDNRAYNRVMEMCPIALKFIGENRRKELADKAREEARRIMTDAQ